MSMERSNALLLDVLKVAMLSKPRWAAVRFTDEAPHSPDSETFVGKERSFSVLFSFFFQTYIINSYSPIFLFWNLTAYE